MLCLTSLPSVFAQEDCSRNITTTFAGGNGSDGNMFEVNAINNIFITGFSVNANGTGNIYIYSKDGSYSGSYFVPGDWTFSGSASIIGSPGNPVFVPLVLNIGMLAGTTKSFYITGDNANTTVNYTDGIGEGTPYAGNGDLIVEEGIGIAYPFGLSFYSPRVFNGIIHYGTGHSSICSVVPTTYNDNNNNNGIMFDVTASNSVNVEELYLDFSSGFFGNVRVYTRPGTHVGFENDSTGWTLLSNEFIVGPINNLAEFTGEYLNTFIAAGNTQAFYIATDNIIHYDNGTGSVGDIVYSDANIQIKSGTGKGGALFANSNNTPRNFNGSIGYCVSSVGMNELNSTEIQIYPNPSEGILNIQSDMETIIEQIEIIDMSGKSLALYTNSVQIINIESLQNGIYFFKIKTNKGEIVKKISKI